MAVTIYTNLMEFVWFEYLSIDDVWTLYQNGEWLPTGQLWTDPVDQRRVINFDTTTMIAKKVKVHFGCDGTVLI